EVPHGRSALKTVRQQVLMRELTLPIVGQHAPPGRKPVSPGVGSAVQAAACCIFPFGFGGQGLAGPAGIGFGILIGDMYHGMILETLDGASRPMGMAPGCPKGKAPPARKITERHRTRRTVE